MNQRFIQPKDEYNIGAANFELKATQIYYPSFYHSEEINQLCN